MNWEAWQIYKRLDTHGRQWDTMGGNMIPLHIRDIRDEAATAGDPDAISERVMLIDGIMLNAHFERQKAKRH